MSPDTKLTLLILLWIADKIIMYLMFHYELKRKRKERKFIIAKDSIGRIGISIDGNTEYAGK